MEDSTIESSDAIPSGTFDVVVDTTGNPSMIQKGLEATAPGGKLILCGQPSLNSSVTLPNMSQHYQGKTIMDSQGGQTDPDTDIPRYLNLVKMGKVDFTYLIGQIGSLEQINELIADMRCGRTIGRCLIRM
jgi:Zn-dependent alcohol dehydrogenase